MNNRRFSKRTKHWTKCVYQFLSKAHIINIIALKYTISILRLCMSIVINGVLICHIVSSYNVLK